MSVGPYRITTKYGDMAATITEANHMHLDLNGGAQKVPNCGLTIRGIKYHGGIHVHRWDDGIWRIGAEWQEEKGKDRRKSTEWERRRNLYIRRENAWNFKDHQQSPSDSSLDKITEAVELAVNDFVKVMEPLGVFQRAQRIMLTGQLNSALGDEDKARQAYDQAQAVSQKARERLEAAGGPVYTCGSCGAFRTNTEYSCHECGAYESEEAQCTA